MGVEVDVLVRMGGFPEDIKVETAVGLAVDVNVQHVDVAINLLLLSPFDVGMQGVDVCEEGFCVVGVDGGECIVGLAHPERGKDARAFCSKSSMKMSERGLDVDLPMPNPLGWA